MQRRLGAWFQIQWMHAYRAIDIRVALGQALDHGGVVGTDANTQEVADASGARRIQGSIQRAAMGSEVETIKVAMGVDQHSRRTRAKGKPEL